MYSSSRFANNKRKNGGRYVNNPNYYKHDVGYYKQYYSNYQDDVVSVSSVKSSLRGGDEEFHVDKAAEEFIERFYRELMLQKWNMARESTTAVDRFG